jgi:ELWxxDGT repeat protein
MKKTHVFFDLACIFIAFNRTQNIVNVKDINVNGTGSYPFDFTLANNKLFFLAQDDISGYSLWITRGNGSNTKKLSPANPGITIADIIAYNNKIYFSYDDGIHGYELWVSDGTVAGTMLFKDLYPGSTGSYPQAFTVANINFFLWEAV